MQSNLHQQDQQQRDLALNPLASFIVQAPAGSGKTELLIQRYLTLLSRVNKPEEILSITFTKKAANEMRLRVIKAIKSAQYEPEPESAHAKKTWLIAQKVLERDKTLNWQIANNPNQLRIQTIDSLCANLTKHLPLLAHFGAQPDIGNNQTPLYEEAVRNVLFHIEEDYPWSADIANLLRHLDNDLNKLLELLVGMLKQRDQWLPYIHLDTNNNIKSILEAHLQAMVDDSLDTIEALFPFELSEEIENLATRFEWVEGLQKWRALSRLLLTEDKSEASWRKSVNKNIGFPSPSDSKNPQEKAFLKESKDRMMVLLGKLQEYDDFKSALHELKFIPDATYSTKQWQMLTSLFSVLKICTAQLRVIFQQQGVIDYIENSQAAIFALGNDEHPTDLALALDYQIKHILIDEFQDTSLTQYNLLEKLITGWEPNDGRTLFIVGDPMQSIYRFREAEVGIFIRMWENGINGLHLTPLTLSVNFRSTSAIINWNNGLFEKIFPSINAIASGSVTYTPSTPHHKSSADNADSFIQLYGFVNASDQVTAKHITDTISQLNVTYPNDSIAILVRSRSCLKAIIPALKTAGIPYHAVEIDKLSSRQTIQDLFALTRALIHPADRIAWLSILRAPWCGLTLNDLHVIAGQRAHGNIYTQLSSQSVISTLSLDGQRRLKRILPALKWAITQRQRLSLRAWVETVWMNIGGPACLSHQDEMNDVQTYFSLLGQFDADNQQVNLETLKQNIDNLYAGTNTNHANVHLMTIHNAKGLEFDTVILPHLEARTPNDDKRLLLWMDRPLANNKTALLLAPVNATGDEDDRLYNYIKRQLKMKLDLEIDRLLYVAATRAKKRLFLAFNVTRGDDDKIKSEPGSFLKKCWPLFEVDPSLELIQNTNHSENSRQEHPLPRGINRIQSNWVHPLKLLPADPYAAHITSAGFSLPDDNKRILGTTAHSLFQQLTKLGIQWWENQSQKKQRDYLQRQLLANGLSNDIETHLNQLSQMIKNILSDERGRWILSSHCDEQSEYPLTAIIKGKVTKLVIDRTFLDDNGARWIIDYKTSPTSEEAAHIEQLETYKQAFKMIENRPLRLGLYFPAIPAWRELT